MKHLLLVIFCLFAARDLCAGKPPVQFDVPYSLEHGKYIVMLETPVGPRRFVFDTGSPVTVIRESLREELGLKAVRTIRHGDYEGHSGQLARVRIDSIRLGRALYRNLMVTAMPDSSLVFDCLHIDGIVGCDLLRGFAIRMTNADSTITFANDVRAFGRLEGRHSTRMNLDRGCPDIAVVARNGKRVYSGRVCFDTGSAGYYDFSLKNRKRIERGFAVDLHWTEGYSANMGWTNRSSVNEQFRGMVPKFVVAGTTIENMPVGGKHGKTDVLGCAILNWGQVVLDFRGKRFWFLPYEDAPPVAPAQPLYNFMPWMVGGELVVGQVWDPALLDMIAPGDRIVTVNGNPWTGDICEFLFTRGIFSDAVLEIVTGAGQHLFIALKKL